ncbi:polycystin-1-like isoform X2 [Brachionus plicatilis]|uniref:Polycystin-1-like isoform X2 n=1 Tax=Brachionus plicatilis TaxID=10195 RepID=A0A3M7S3H3_BRAPC|nr:polycystin-1-like isoform X2 [Brachionus plicatilis]
MTFFITIFLTNIFCYPHDNQTGDGELFGFGIKVPQKISNSLASLSTGTSIILLYNTFFQFDGTLRAAEIYANSSGDIQLSIYLYSPCSTSFSKLKNPKTCVDYKTSYQFDCATSFDKNTGRCSNDQIGAADFYGSSSTDFTQVKTETISLNQGYNLIIPFGGNTQIKQGWILGMIQTTALVSIDMSNSALLSDYVDTLPVNNSINAAFHVRAFVSRPIILSTFSLYPKSVHQLTASVYHPVVIGPVSSNFVIYDKITELRVDTMDNGQCKENVECLFTALHMTGNNVTYKWSFPSENVTKMSPELPYVFTESGSFEIFLLASNPVSNESVSFMIKVIVPVKNPRLTLNNSEGASAVGKNADFLFTLEKGLGYVCTINYGDSGTDQFDDSLTSLNNSLFSHTYSAEGVYKVKILCINSISNDSYEIDHSVQFEVTNLRLTKWFSFRNVLFTVDFAIDTGSAVQFELWYDQVRDLAANFDSLTKTGSSSSRTAASSGLYKVNITVWNKISRVNLLQDFEIGSKIRNPQFLLTNTDSFAPTHYHFGTQLNFLVKMDDGANVKLRFYFGDQVDPSVPSLEVNTTGDWNSDYSVSYTHINPGDFVIQLTVLNAFDTFTLNQSISVVSDVNNLVPGLAENPVIFSPLGSFAYFMFSYAGDTKSGSHARVTFWPGDMFNQSFGPYLIGMNFRLNASVNSLMYRYQGEGEYKAVFLVENMLGSKFYDLIFNIKQGYELVQFLILRPTDVSVADNQTFTTSTAKNASLIVRASDSSSAQILKYIIQIQNPIENASIHTNPVDTTEIIHDGINDLINPYLIPINLAYTSPNLQVQHYHTRNNLVLKISIILGPTRSRTIGLTIEALGSPTNPYVLVDFGDGNAPENEKYLSGSLDLSYEYQTIGLYTINITIFNKISSKSFFKSVKILSDIAAFDCVPKWRLVPVDGTEETTYASISNGVYSFDKERDLRLHCSWKNGIIERFIIDINGIRETYLDFSSLNYVRSGQSYQIILPFKTDKFRRDFSLNATFYSAIILENAVENTTIFAPGSPHTFLINFETLAEPSCASVILTDTNYRSRPISIGTDASTCSTFFPGLAYNGSYDIVQSTWRINFILQIEGNIKMTATVRNSASEKTVSTSVTVTSLPCAPPLLSIEDRAEFFFLPIEVARTKMIILLAESILRCNLTLSNERGWQLYLVNQANGEHISQIDLSGNPTEKNAEIVIRPNTLSYGLYKFVYFTRMTGSNLMGRNFESRIDTYVRVVPTGIVVWGLKGGVAERRLGIEQELEFTPTAFSFDQDSLVSILSLKFKFFCTVVDSGIVRPYPSRNAREKLDLFSLKNGSHLMTSNTTCFEDPSGFEFGSSGNSIKISTAYLAYYKTRAYRFMISTEYLGQEYYQEFDLWLEFVKKTPIISLGSYDYYNQKRNFKFMIKLND